MRPYWFDDNLPWISGVVVIGLVILAVWLLYRADRKESASIQAQCISYMEEAQSPSDRLHARIACDQLWAIKKAKDAADAAAMLSASQAGRIR